MSPAQRILDHAAKVEAKLEEWPRGAGLVALSAMCDLSEADTLAALAYLFGAAKVIDTSDDGERYRWTLISL